MGVKFFCLFILTLLFNINNAAKILVVCSTAAHRNNVMLNTYARALLDAGHNITYVSPIKDQNPPKSPLWREIHISGVKERYDNSVLSRRGFNLLVEKHEDNSVIYNTGIRNTLFILKHRNMQKLIKSNDTFDVVVVEQNLNDALKGLAPHFKASLILFSPTDVTNDLNYFMKNPSPTSYVTDPKMDLPKKLNFWERARNALETMWELFYKYLFIYPKHAVLVREFISKDIDCKVAFYNASLALVNGDLSYNDPKPLIPNIIQIGGFHIQKPKKLPEDIQKFLDGANDGAIYVADIIKCINNKKKWLYRLQFSYFKQKALWIFGNEFANKDIMTSMSFPQSDVLAHPNIKLVITRGGYMTIPEAVYHGKPVLALPLFDDEFHDARRIEEEGWGRMLNCRDLSEIELREAVYDIMNNSKYEETAQLKSKIFHDKLATPMEKAVYWTEYVIRYRGAPHLRIEGANMSYYEYFNIDSYIILFCSLSLTIIFGIFLFFVYNKAFRSIDPDVEYESREYLKLQREAYKKALMEAVNFYKQSLLLQKKKKVQPKVEPVQRKVEPSQRKVEPTLYDIAPAAKANLRKRGKKTSETQNPVEAEEEIVAVPSPPSKTRSRKRSKRYSR